MKKERQRYEIYYNEKKIILIHNELISNYIDRIDTLIMPYRGKVKALFQFIDTIENSTRFTQIVIHTDQLFQLWLDFKSLFVRISAAGGIISNKDREILLIYRRSYWDLPKGKLEKMESFETAAIRECEEEVGLKGLILDYKITSSYHIYREKNNKRALKQTKWFSILYDGVEEPILQYEEDIESYQWLSLQNALQVNPIYRSIYSVLLKYQKKKAVI
ncbi:MAG: NUDIX domain-containing protein [Saprospiraceae bacterium]|jgi:8-oxo-dGTP pyrophosphatase MutT (NUDIX family)|nr:NUDIX domain-containing protein [Saprospiraceae bacterium]MBK9995371.1 NUDIX domain-containing protein [Saprospiraceae bacterium]